MAYNSNQPRAEYTASATQTVFPFLFKIFATSDIKVYQTLAGATPDDVADILVLTTDYTVTINGDAGGEVILNTGAAVNDKITLVRNLSVTRATEYQQNGDLLASTLNSDQEYQTYLIADNVSNDSRYIKVPDSVQNVSTSLPAPVSDAYIKWNATANAIENETSVPDAVATSTANAAAAAASATQAELYEWEAEAERLTADSYATEAEDTFVNLVTSDGDGTFSYTPTTDYSALHWAAKSMAGDIAPIIHAATSKTTPVDADEFAITDSAATFGLKKLTWANLKTTLGALFATLASPAFTGIPTAPTATAGTKTTQLATTDFANSLLAEYVVTGAAATSIDFTGLDIGSHKSYRIEIENVNNVANSYIHLFANGDTTITNYTEQYLIGVSTTPLTTSVTAPRLGLCKTVTTVSTICATIMQVGGYVVFQSHNFAETNDHQLYVGRSNATKTNLTQLTFTHSVANGFGIGSKIRIYRGDV